MLLCLQYVVGIYMLLYPLFLIYIYDLEVHYSHESHIALALAASG
jgi:hypothetical protein